MRPGLAFRVSFGNGSLFDTVVSVLSFNDGDDAVSLARVAAECPALPVHSIERIGLIWANA